MRNVATVLLVSLITLFAAAGCNGKPNKGNANTSNDDKVSIIPDTTIYGTCGDGTAMHTLELVSDQGDTINFLVNMDGDDNVKGGLLVGDRMAVVPGKVVGGDKTAQVIINLTTLLGRWTSIDRNFEIQEGGIVQSYLKAESNPWTSWKVFNGDLILNRDTFTINNLGADSLYMENDKGIFAYKRVR